MLLCNVFWLLNVIFINVSNPQFIQVLTAPNICDCAFSSNTVFDMFSDCVLFPNYDRKFLAHIFSVYISQTIYGFTDTEQY